MEKNNKIKILIVPSDHFGVGSFRSVAPAVEMAKNFSEEVDVEINYSPNLEDIEYLKKFDIIHFHRGLGPKELEDVNFNRIKSLGIKLVCDLDDYPIPFAGHPMYLMIMKEKFPEKIFDTLKKVDYITTTTSIFKEELEKINTKAEVFVIPNAINREDKMWQNYDPRERDEKGNVIDDRVRISWIGGSSHLLDLKLMENSFNLLHTNEELKGKYQTILSGFDVRGVITKIDENNNHTQHKMEPHQSIWYAFEKILSADYKAIENDPEYVKWLKNYKAGEYPNVLSKSYVRRNTLPLTRYATHYDYADITLAPLDAFDKVTKPNGQIVNQLNIFNKVKSELKIIEAGMKKKALIAQDFGIYKELLKNEDTALLVSKNEKGWYQAMRRLILEPDLREKLANNLHEFVKDKYDIKNVTKDRIEIYKQILQQKEEFILQPIK